MEFANDILLIDETSESRSLIDEASEESIKSCNCRQEW